MAFKDNASAVTRLNDYNLRDLGGSASFEVQTISGRGLAPTRDRELQFPGEVGARNYGSFPSVRRIEVTGLLYANTQPDFRIGLDKLKELCRNRIKLNEVLYGEVEAQTLWFADEGVVHEGTAQAGATTTITLDTSASSTDDYYNDMEVEIIGGTGDGQVRKITDYTGSSRVATIAPLFATTPDSTSQFWVRDNRYYLVNYSGTMNETRITNQWMRTGYSNVTLPFKAVMPFAVSDWKKQNIASVNGGDFQAIETGTAPSYPRYEIKGGGASSTNPAIIETTTAFQSNFNAAQGTGIANTVITPSVSTGIKHQTGKLNQAIEFDQNASYRLGEMSTTTITPIRPDLSIADILNVNQATIAFWFKKNQPWSTTTSEYLLDNGSVGNDGRIIIYYYPTTGQLVFWVNSKSIASDSGIGGTLSVGNWFYFVGRWDVRRTIAGGANTMDFNVYNSSGSAVITKTTTANIDDPTACNTQLTMARYTAGEGPYYFDGNFDDFAIWDRPLTDSEVTALVNGGTGARADSIGSSDLVYYSDFDGTVGTDMVNPIASSNVDTAYASATTTTAVTVNGNGDKIFADNDRIVLYDETGYKQQGFVNGTPTSTTVTVDDGAGGAIGDVDTVGVYATFSGSNYFVDASNTGIDWGDGTTALDYSVSMWIRIPVGTSLASYPNFFGKGGSLYAYGIEMYAHAGNVWGILLMNSVGTAYLSTTGTSAIADGKWHCVGFSVDDSAPNLTLYVDGVAEGTPDTTKTGTADSGAGALAIGSTFNGAQPFTGDIRDVSIWAGTALTAANHLALATNPLNSSGSVSTPDSWWKLNESSLSAPTDSGAQSNTLTNNGSVTRTQQAYISKNLIADGNCENGGIGGWTPLEYVTSLVPVKETDANFVLKDAQGVYFSGATYLQGLASQFTSASGEDYVFRAWVTSGSSNSVAINFNDGNYNPQTNGVDLFGHVNYSAGWAFIESCLETPYTTTQMNFYAGGSYRSLAIDDMKILPNLVPNGGMEGGADPPTGWTASGGTATSNTDEHSGTYSLLFVSTHTSYGHGFYQALTLESDQYYEFSFWAKVSTTGGIKINLPLGDATYYSETFTLTTSWARYSFTAKTNTWSSGNLWMNTGSVNPQNTYIDDISIVHRPDLSPTLTAMSTNYRYEPTRLGMGYHTGGNENMVYAAVGNKDQSAGRVVFRPQFPYTTGENQQIFAFYADAAAGTVYGLNYDASVDKFSLTKGAGGSYYTATSVAQNFSVNDEIEVGWYTDPSSGVQIFVNGSDSGSTRNANTTSLATNPATLYIGDNSAYSVASNMVIDDLEILTKSMPAEWFAEQYAKRLASKNQNLYLSYYGTLDTGDILTLDCANTKIVTRAELYDASAGTRTSAINNATIYGSKMPILSERKSMLYFPATISNGVDIHFKKSWQ